MVAKVFIVVVLGMFSIFHPCIAQTKVSGQVVDAETKQGIAGVTVSLSQTTQATSTDSSGFFELVSSQSSTSIQFRALGYKTLTKDILNDQEQTIHIELEEDYQALDEIVIKGKSRYSNRDNPAVELIRKVIEHKKLHRLSRYDHVSFEAYEKINMAISNFPRFIANSAFTRGYKFIFENIDTTLVPGRKLLPIYLEENISQQYLRLSPHANKTRITATKKTMLDERYVINENIATYFKFIHGDIDIYENNILILNKPFLGPTAESAPLFYRYYITDTITVDERQFVELTFVPRNNEDRLFSGQLQISLDGNYGIRRADIWIGQKANLNWVNDVNIALRFTRHDSSTYLLSQSDMKVNFGLSKSSGGAFGQRTLVYRNYDTDAVIPDSVFAGQQVVSVADTIKTEQFWEQRRPLPLRKSETNTYTNFDSLSRVKSFKRTQEWLAFAFTSFKNVGPVELGPLEYLYSFNELEGSRIRIGGRTSRQFSEKFFSEAYTAYGFRDDRWKYYLGAAYTLNGKRIAEYPAHYLHATYQQETLEPGQDLGFLNGDSFFRSFRKGPQDKWLYNNAFKLNHVIEFGNHVMLQTHFAYLKQAPAAELTFIKANANAEEVRALETSEIGVGIRWAPNEEYFQRNLTRSPIINEYPVLNVRYNMGINGLLGGAYDYQALRMDILKRVFLSQLGFADVNVGAGYIWGTMPYPLLDIPNANQTYVLTTDSYNLMNNLEFVSDQYIKLSIEHRMHGFLLNKIPLIKKLKIREILGFKLLYGNVRANNRPENNPDLFHFPTDDQGNRSTFTLERKPYMEASAGLENILNVFRVEYVRRLSYLHHPGIDRDGIRIGVKLDF